MFTHTLVAKDKDGNIKASCEVELPSTRDEVLEYFGGWKGLVSAALGYEVIRLRQKHGLHKREKSGNGTPSKKFVLRDAIEDNFSSFPDAE